MPPNPSVQSSTKASLVAQMVKNLPAMQETWVQSLSQEDPLEKGMATYPSILVWKIPWTEEPGGPQSMGRRRESDMTEQLTHNLLPPFLASFGTPPNNSFSQKHHELAVIILTREGENGVDFPYNAV